MTNHILMTSATSRNRFKMWGALFSHIHNVECQMTIISAELRLLSDMVLIHGKPSGGQRCVAVYRLCLFRVEEETGTVTVTVCDLSICLLIRGKWERAPLCSAWGLARSTGGGLCEASHCYMMPEGGYQSNGSQDTQEREGGLDSDPGMNTQWQELVKVGRAEISEAKADVSSGYCYYCTNWQTQRIWGRS